MLNALVEADIGTVNVPETKLTALIIPVPDLERFNPKPPFGNVTTYTWGLVHGTTVTGAIGILIEGLIRPADWEHDDDPKRSQVPTFGLFSMGQQVSRGDTELPRWAEIALLDRASKKGKGQQPILVGAVYRGSKQHVAMKAGGNDAVQIKVAKLGVATSSEKYVVTHSAHTQVRFVAVTWEELPPLKSIDADDDESDNVNYRQSRNYLDTHQSQNFGWASYLSLCLHGCHNLISI